MKLRALNTSSGFDGLGIGGRAAVPERALAMAFSTLNAPPIDPSQRVVDGVTRPAQRILHNEDERVAIHALDAAKDILPEDGIRRSDLTGDESPSPSVFKEARIPRIMPSAEPKMNRPGVEQPQPAEAEPTPFLRI